MKRALCIGINDYGGSNNLAGCVNDCEDWVQLMTTLGCATILRYRDRAATGDEIRNAIVALMGRMESGDHAIVTYSGHGSFVPDLNSDEPDGVDECWCLADVFESERGIVTDDELASLLSQRPSGTKVTVISDSCHSGSMTRQFALGDPGEERRRIRFLHPSDFLSSAQRSVMRFGTPLLRAKKKPEGVVHLAGCRDDQYSYDAWFGTRANGAFTRAAVDAFKPTRSYRAWFAAIGKKLPSRDYPQNPVLTATWCQGRRKALA